MGAVHHIDVDAVTNEVGINEQCIECLEVMLEKARNGEIVGVVAAVQHADGSTSGPVGGFIHNSRIVGELFMRMHMMAG